jgi:hypothetical protein
MKLWSSLAMASALVASSLAFSAPASAVTATYAQFTQRTNARLLNYVRLGSTAAPTGNRIFTSSTLGGTLGAIGVNFTYLINTPLALQGFQTAAMTIDAQTALQSIASGTSRNQGGFAGSIRFIRSTPYLGLTNLLTLTFTGATLTTTQGGGSGSLIASTPGSSIVATSDFLTFAPNVQHDFSLALSALQPSFASNGPSGYGRNTRGNVSGTFASDPAPTAVPEPATWAMLILGFGLVGVASRRRKASVSVTA